MGNPVVWVELSVQDMSRAKTFYEAVLGRPLDPVPMPDAEMAMFRGEEGYGSSGALFKMAGVPSGGNSTLVYFTCEDCAVEAGRVAAAGGRIFREKFAIGEHGFCALAFDTEGNMFGLHSMK